MAKKPHEYGIGETADGAVNTFPPSELPARLAELDEMERAALGEDDLADLGDVEGLFEPDQGKKKLSGDEWRESDHPRGQPENAGEFAAGPGGASSKEPSGASRFADKGPRLPDVVYRGATPENEQRSSMAPTGVYVSTDQKTAAQWGDAKEYNVHKQPKLLDLGDYHNPDARAFVAAWTGNNDLSADEFEGEAAEIFIQNSGADQLKKHGYDGYRFGRDAFLLGDLSRYAEHTSGGDR